MTWNWQQEDWPHFRYDARALKGYEAEFLQSCGVLIGALKHVGAQDQKRLTVDLISDEALKTSEIEGEILDRDSVQSSILRHFGLHTDRRRIAPVEAGIAEMVVDVYEGYDAPLSHDMLFQWHGMVMNGRRDIQDIGRYRTDEEPMQIVSGPIHKPAIHFEAPPAGVVDVEMARFLEWFNMGSAALPAVTRAGIAHLYFECIHPFEDGNGRIGRAVADKALSQVLGQPTLIALSHAIQHQKKAYYKALEENNRDMEITDWLVYFARTVLQAQAHTQRMIDFLIAKTKLYDRLRGTLNARQDKVMARLFRAGPEGFEGGLSAENYIAITETSRATATRDLVGLVGLGALRKTGERKHTRYWLEI